MAKVKTDEKPDLAVQREKVKALTARQKALEDEIFHLNGVLNPHVETPRSGTKHELRKARIRLLKAESELDETLDALEDEEKKLTPLLDADREKRIREENLKLLEMVDALVAGLKPLIPVNLAIKARLEGRSAKGLPNISDQLTVSCLLEETPQCGTELGEIERWAQKQRAQWNGRS